MGEIISESYIVAVRVVTKEQAKNVCDLIEQRFTFGGWGHLHPEIRVERLVRCEDGLIRREEDPLAASTRTEKETR